MTPEDFKEVLRKEGYPMHQEEPCPACGQKTRWATNDWIDCINKDCYRYDRDMAHLVGSLV